MYFIVVHLQVEDFAKWKAAFDRRHSDRAEHGCKSERVFRDEHNHNYVTLLLEWNDLGRARRWFESIEAQQARDEAGVRKAPEYHFLHEVSRLPL